MLTVAQGSRIKGSASASASTLSSQCDRIRCENTIAPLIPRVIVLTPTQRGWPARRRLRDRVLPQERLSNLLTTRKHSAVQTEDDKSESFITHFAKFSTSQERYYCAPSSCFTCDRTLPELEFTMKNREPFRLQWRKCQAYRAKHFRLHFISSQWSSLKWYAHPLWLGKIYSCGCV